MVTATSASTAAKPPWPEPGPGFRRITAPTPRLDAQPEGIGPQPPASMTMDAMNRGVATRMKFVRMSVDEGRHQALASPLAAPHPDVIPSPDAPPDFDNGRISALAAGLTIGGHAAVLFAALLLGDAAEQLAARTVVGVTLVSGGPPGPGDATGAAASPARLSRPASPAPPAPTAKRRASALDRLITPSTTPFIAKPMTEGSATPERPMANDTATLASSRTVGGTGSSRAGQGLEPGEEPPASISTPAPLCPTSASGRRDRSATSGGRCRPAGGRPRRAGSPCWWPSRPTAA